MILMTGGAGFIGANFILDWLAQGDEPVVNLDKLAHAGSPDNLASLARDVRHIFVQGDINDGRLVAALLAAHRPRAVLHLADECDAGDDGHAVDCARANLNGTLTLLEAVRTYWLGLPPPQQATFRFLYLSSAKVYGALGPQAAPSTEAARHAPDSPHAASQAAVEQLVGSCHRSWGLPTLVAVGSNNYGPFQFPDKLIPQMLAHALAGKPLPVYGDGLQRRDWLHVGDCCAALRYLLATGRPGRSYHVCAGQERSTLEVVHLLCDLLDELAPPAAGGSHHAGISFVAGQPGHAWRRALDAGLIGRELGWKPAETFESGMRKTVRWYLAHQDWVQDVRLGSYLKWMEKKYSRRPAFNEAHA